MCWLFCSNLLTALHVDEFIVTIMVAGSIAVTVRERKRHASTAAVKTSLSASLWRLPVSACLLTNFSKLQESRRREEGEISSSASVEAANINGANYLTWGNVTPSLLLLFANGIKEYLWHLLILDRESFQMKCYHIELWGLDWVCVCVRAHMGGCVYTYTHTHTYMHLSSDGIIACRSSPH